MTSRKKIRRARRHTLGMLAEAETALLGGESALALKLVRRALEAGAMNARVHADAASLLRDLGHAGEAEAAARRAHELAPAADFVRVAWRELGLAEFPIQEAAPASPDLALEPAPATALAPRTERSARFALDVARAALGHDGVAVATEWWTWQEQTALAGLAADAPAFSAAMALATPRGSLGWAALRRGGMDWLDAALDEAYACAAELANALRAELGDAGRFPLACPLEALPHVERAVRLQLMGGAVYPERSDAGDRATFALRACLALGPAPITIAIVDRRPGKRRERLCQVPAGAAAWFAARERPVMVGGVLGLQAVAWELRAVGDAAAIVTSWADVLAR